MTKSKVTVKRIGKLPKFKPFEVQINLKIETEEDLEQFKLFGPEEIVLANEDEEIIGSSDTYTMNTILDKLLAELKKFATTI